MSLALAGCGEGTGTDAGGLDAEVELDAGGRADGSVPGFCGDGFVDPGEMCDDGGNAASDGCSADCRREDGWFCSDAPSACAEICGDGRVVGTEICDDGNIVACGGCAATCNGAGSGGCDDGTGCTSDGDCSSGVCDATEDTCIACTSDAACTGSPNGSECVSGDCRACDPSDGSGCVGSSVCDADTFTCTGCGSDADCGGQQCVAGTCRPCDPSDDAGCSEPAGVCTPGTFVCVDCAGDSDCGGLECVSNACRACDPIDDAGCTVSAPQCEPSLFACVECTGDLDCLGTERCVGNVCVGRTTAAGSIFYRGDSTTNGLDELARYDVMPPAAAMLQVFRTGVPAAVSSFDVSHDGTRVALTSDLELVGRFDLHVMNRDASGVTRVVMVPDFADVSEVLFSPDGTRLAFEADIEADGLRDVYVVPVSGGAYVRVSPTRSLSDASLQPGAFAWSRDSRYLAISGDFEVNGAVQLYVTDANAAFPTAVPAFPASAVGSVGVSSRGVQSGLIAWTADNRVIMKGLMGTDVERGLFQVDSNGLNFMRVPGTTGDIGSFGISADGRRLALAADTGAGGHEIYVMPANASSAPARVTDGTIPDLRGPSFFELLRFSPNGALIAFTADIGVFDNKYEPYVVPVIGGTPRRLVAIGGDATQEATNITWSLDSSRIAFIADSVLSNDVYLYLTNDVITTDQSPVLVQFCDPGEDVVDLLFRP